MEAERLRVLVANEPRAYRDAMAGAIQHLRPEVEVILAEPAELAVLLETVDPHMVIASTREGRARALTWVTLYPTGRWRAVVRCGDEERETEDLELDEILALVDKTASSRGKSSHIHQMM